MALPQAAQGLGGTDGSHRHPGSPSPRGAACCWPPRPARLCHVSYTWHQGAPPSAPASPHTPASLWGPGLRRGALRPHTALCTRPRDKSAVTGLLKSGGFEQQNSIPTHLEAESKSRCRAATLPEGLWGGSLFASSGGRCSLAGA